MTGTVAEFIFFNGKTFVTVKRTFLKIKSMAALVDYAYSSDFFREYHEAGYFLKTINIL